MSKPKGDSRPAIDWDAIEKVYRLGQATMRQIAKAYGVDVSNVSRRAKREGWVQDKSAEVAERTRAAMLKSATYENNRKRNTPTREDVDVAVATNVAMLTGHRRDIAELRELAANMTAELREGQINRDEIDAMIWEETKGDKDGKRRAAMLRAVALQGRAVILGNLATATKTVITLDRQAHGIADKPEEEPQGVTVQLVRFGGAEA